MRVLMLDDKGAGVGYYRFVQPRDALLRGGYTCDVVKLYDMTYAESYKLLDVVRNYDIIHAGYTDNLRTVELLVALREHARIPLVVDIDDDITNVPAYNQAFKSYHRGAPQRRIAHLSLRVADAVCASTAHLATAIRDLNPNVAVIENYHQPRDWEGGAWGKFVQGDTSFRLMSASGTGRFDDYEECKVGVVAEMHNNPQVRLFFVSFMPDWALEFMPSSTNPHANRSFYIRHCDIATYRQALQYVHPHVFIAPAAPNVFNTSKSCIKAYDAAECGAALVCSDWPTYEGVPALRASTPTQWCESLHQLWEDGVLRTSMSRKLQQWARNERNIDNHIHARVHFYKETCAKPVGANLRELAACPSPPQPQSPSQPLLTES